MIYPKFLKENDTISVIAPSGGARDELHKNRYKQAEKYFKSQNYNLLLSKYINDSKTGRSASKQKRALEVNESFKNKDVDFILCATGGDFLVEILPFVDFNLLVNNPKYVAGFSDPTGLLFPITTKYDIATIYGSNFSSFGALKLEKYHTDFLNVITNKLLEETSYDKYEEESFEKVTGLEGNNFTEKVYWKILNQKKVDVTGRIIGGCFDIINELLKTPYDGVESFIQKYQKDGIIWYFDNCELSMEETIRVLWHMNELHYFEHCKAIIFGRFGINNTCYGYDVESCLKDSVISELNIPIIYDADISHKDPTLTIINGSIAHLICENGKGKISFELV